MFSLHSTCLSTSACSYAHIDLSYNYKCNYYSFVCYYCDSRLTVATNFTCNIFQFHFHSKTKLAIALRVALKPTKHAEYFIFWEFQELFFLSLLLLLFLLLLLVLLLRLCFLHSFLLFCVSRARIKIVFVCGSACWFRLLSEMWNAKWKMRQEGEGGRTKRKEKLITCVIITQFLLCFFLVCALLCFALNVLSTFLRSVLSSVVCQCHALASPTAPPCRCCGEIKIS